jgi:ribose transport system substrate-binding protein
LQKAVDAKPDAVTFGGPAYELWSQFIPQFEKIGAVIIPSYVGPIPLSKTVPVNVAGPVNDEAMAKALARWVADDSGGKANVLVQTISSFKAIVGWAKFFQDELAKICPHCKTSTINNSAVQFSGPGAAQSIVSEVRKNPKINYFVGYNGAFFSGLNQQLKNAQLHVKVGGMFPLPQNVQDVQNGSGGAFLAVSNAYTAWAIFDVALRHAQGAPQVPEDQQVFPMKLVTKASAKTTDGNYSGPANTEELFKKLWQVD